MKETVVLMTLHDVVAHCVFLFVLPAELTALLHDEPHSPYSKYMYSSWQQRQWFSENSKTKYA